MILYDLKPHALRSKRQLEDELQKLDSQYDACNAVMAAGEVGGFSDEWGAKLTPLPFISHPFQTKQVNWHQLTAHEVCEKCHCSHEQSDLYVWVSSHLYSVPSLLLVYIRTDSVQRFANQLYIQPCIYRSIYIYTNHISYVYLSTCTWTPCAQNCPGVHRPAQWKLRLGEYLSKWTWCTALHLATATVRNAKKYEKKDTDLVGAPVKKEKKEKREKEKREKKSKSSKRKTGEAEAETKTPTRKSKKSKTNWFLGWYMLIFFDLGDGLPTNSNRHLLEYQQLYLRVTRGNLQHPVMKFNRIALAGYVYFSGPSPCPCQNAQPLVNMCSWCNIYIYMNVYLVYIGANI